MLLIFQVMSLSMNYSKFVIISKNVKIVTTQKEGFFKGIK